MGFIKHNKNKVISTSLIAAVVGLTFFNIVVLFNNQGVLFDSKSNSVSVQKIDDYNARVHSDSVKASRNDFLFCKSEKF